MALGVNETMQLDRCEAWRLARDALARLSAAS
jgi:hypothetical protein